jgi:hypothetical protein
MECPKCGLSLGSHEVHQDGLCRKQQEVNRKNLGIACTWCGAAPALGHKAGCPRRTKDPEPTPSGDLKRRRA